MLRFHTSWLLLLLFLLLLIGSKCQQDCTFHVHNVTGSSVFPAACSRIVGRFRVDENSQLSDNQLSALFTAVREIRGVLQIWNTALSALTFTQNIRVISGDPLDKMLSIVNNTRLTSISLKSLNQSLGSVEIRNNPALDLKPNCPVLHSVFFTRRLISSNLFDCGCELREPATWPQVTIPADCIVLYGNLVLEGPSPPLEHLYRLLTVTTIYGSIIVKNSNIESLGFLQNLKEIESGPDADYTLSISFNDYLGRIDLVHLSAVRSQNPDSKVDISVDCFDPAFVSLLLNSHLKIESLSGAFCDLSKINNPSTYCTGKLSAVNDRCTRYIGNLIYLNPNSWYSMEPSFNYTKVPQIDLKRIQQFEFIFGQLRIQASGLTNLSLPNLREIYSFGTWDEGATIFLQDNRLLREFSIPNLRIVYNTILLKGNSNLTHDEDATCRSIASHVTTVGTLGIDSDYDCRPYLKEEKEEPTSTPTTVDVTYPTTTKYTCGLLWYCDGSVVDSEE